MFPFSITLGLRMEYKHQKYSKFLRNLNNDVQMLDSNMPLLTNNFKVCLLNGDTINPLAIIDEDFGIFATNSYRIIRSAEMF